MKCELESVKRDGVRWWVCSTRDRRYSLLHEVHINWLAYALHEDRLVFVESKVCPGKKWVELGSAWNEEQDREIARS